MARWRKAKIVEAQPVTTVTRDGKLETKYKLTLECGHPKPIPLSKKFVDRGWVQCLLCGDEPYFPRGGAK